MKTINRYDKRFIYHTIDDRCLEWPRGAYPISEVLVARKFGGGLAWAEETGRRWLRALRDCDCPVCSERSGGTSSGTEGNASKISESNGSPFEPVVAMDTQDVGRCCNVDGAEALCALAGKVNGERWDGEGALACNWPAERWASSSEVNLKIQVIINSRATYQHRQLSQ